MAPIIAPQAAPAKGRPPPTARQFVESAYVAIAEAKLPILDWGFLRSGCMSGIPIDLAWLAFPRVVARSLPVDAVSASAGDRARPEPLPGRRLNHRETLGAAPLRNAKSLRTLHVIGFVLRFFAQAATTPAPPSAAIPAPTI
jgi:hypothetical protein